MNYNTDRPIENCSQDLLGRSSFSKRLGKAIFEFNSQDGLVIGLYGKWGTGKTSVINMAINELISLSADDENKPLIMKFAPWNYSDNDNLISLFFQKLKNIIDYQDNEELKKKVGKALSDYSGAFNALSLIPVIGSGLADVIKTFTQVQGENLMKGADLEKTREKLEHALREANKKIIIVIDDIDRLTNSQIRDIFQLVKQVADFPNVIYLLVMDRDVVKSALSEIHNIDGNEYLEKIIQVPFELPELRKSKLYDIFCAKLDKTLQDLSSNVVLDQPYWSNVFRYCVEPYMKTLRDVNRVINTFQFKYGALYQETSFEDMVGITTIEVLEPELYKWISNNKDSVCGGVLHSLTTIGNKKVDYQKQYSEEFSRLGIDPDKSIKSVSALFPVFAKDVKEHYSGYQSGSDIRGKMRIADEERFDLYFLFDLDDIKVPRSIINSCINDLDYDTLRAVIEGINNQGHIVYFLDEVRALIDDIPYERLSLFASAMIDLQCGFHGEKTKALFSLSACDLAEYFVRDLLNKLKTEDERNCIIVNATNQVTKNGLEAITRIIHRIELGYGRLASETEKKEDQLISLDQLCYLEKLYVDRIKEIIASESLLDLNGLTLIIHLWESIDKKGAESYITSLLKDDYSKLKFISAMAGRWTGTKGGGWSYYPDYYAEYISDDEIYDLIQRYDKKKLDDFSEVEQVKLASFVLNYHNNDSDYVNEQEAIKLIAEWKKE